MDWTLNNWWGINECPLALDLAAFGILTFIQILYTTNWTYIFVLGQWSKFVKIVANLHGWDDYFLQKFRTSLPPECLLNEWSVSFVWHRNDYWFPSRPHTKILNPRLETVQMECCNCKLLLLMILCVARDLRSSSFPTLSPVAQYT